MRLRGLFLGLSSLLLAALLAGCASHKGAPTATTQAAGPTKGMYKIGAPYQIQGVWYYPGEDYSYDETGIASWYGPDFHGKYTANGEVYNMNDLTAAHPTLPMPSIVRVTNLENGRSIVLRINDRGPYARGRILDLSRRSAQLLGVIGNGTAKVRVQILPDESRQAKLLAMQGEIPSAERIAAAVPTERVSVQELAPPPGVAAAPAPKGTTSTMPRPAVASSQQIASAQPIAPLPAPVTQAPVTQASAAPAPVSAAKPMVAAPLEPQLTVQPVKPTSIYVQAGAFSQYDNANRAKVRLGTIGPTRLTQVTVSGQPFFRVRLGPARSVPDADRLLDLVVRAGYQDARIVVE